MKPRRYNQLEAIGKGTLYFRKFENIGSKAHCNFVDAIRDIDDENHLVYHIPNDDESVTRRLQTAIELWKVFVQRLSAHVE